MKKKILGLIVLMNLIIVQVCAQNATWEGNIAFTHDILNEVAYIEMDDIAMTGAFEVTIFGGWNYAPSFGKVTKLFSFHHTVGSNTVDQYNSEVVTAHGRTVETYGIGEVLVMDNKVRIPIYKLNEYSGTNLYVQVDVFSNNASSIQNALKLIGPLSEDIGIRLQNSITYKKLKVGYKDVPNGFILAVGGKGIFEEIQIKNSSNWPDFVFEEDYNLLSLTEVEEFIITNKHLPDVASAKQMQKEGVNQSEMNQKLLQKIEELTLYVIKQNKIISDQSQIIDHQNQKLEDYLSRLLILENK
ncbi:hypothetical protein [Labilibaculum euxinus]